MKLHRDWEREKATILRRYDDGKGEGVTALCAHYHTGFAIMRGLLTKWGADMKQQNGQGKADRNEQILQLAKEGYNDHQIAARVAAATGETITRNVVIGVRNRAGVLRDESESRRNRRSSGRHGAAVRDRKPYTLVPKTTPAALVELEKLTTAPKRTTPASQIEEQMAAQWRESLMPEPKAPAPRILYPTEPKPDGETIARPEPAPARVGDRWVPLDERTGCAWPQGDKPDWRFCNAPCCKVKRVGIPGAAERVRYCAEHWLERRAHNSKFTKVAS